METCQVGKKTAKGQPKVAVMKLMVEKWG